jgi:F-type H+-transporting ATPase subunit b
MAEHGEHAVVEHDAHQHQPSVGELFYPAINFLIFAAAIVYFLRGPIREYFRARTTEIRHSLAAGAKAREEAAALRAQIDRELADLPVLRQQMQNDLRATAERERDKLVESAAVAADRIRKDAKLAADHEFEEARRRIRAEVVNGAIGEATAIVRQAVGAEDQARFVRDFVQSAGGRQ